MTTPTRERVLASAAALAARGGFDEIDMAELCASSGVSNGSIYHHFGSKKGVLAALIAEIILDYQDSVFAVLDRHVGDARAAVLKTVAAHLSWTEENRDRAMLLHEHREQVTRGAHQKQVRELNRRFRGRYEAWLGQQAHTGILAPLTMEVAHAVVFAPAREVCRIWLDHADFPLPTSFSDSLGRAAWASLKALPGQTPVRRTVSSP